MSRERYTVGDKPVCVAHTTHDRTPYVSNVGDVDVLLLIAPWPLENGLVLRPGVTVPFINPATPSDATPVFVACACPDGKGEVEILFLR